MCSEWAVSSYRPVWCGNLRFCHSWVWGRSRGLRACECSMPVCPALFEAQRGTEPGGGGNNSIVACVVTTRFPSLNLVFSIPCTTPDMIFPLENKETQKNRHQDTIVSTCSGQTSNILRFFGVVFWFFHLGTCGWCLLLCYFSQSRLKK